MVPTNKKAAKAPRSRSATDLSGTNARNAPTVVTFPTTNGITISLRAVFIFGVWRRCAIKCSG